MAKAKVKNPKQVAARSVNQGVLNQKKAEVRETQHMVQKMQAEAQQRRVDASKVKASVMVSKMNVSREKALANRPKPVATK
ncbi:MAG: hypothetical protein PVI26_13255 [Chitinispirillia bacterium]|jgi:hypothetical protein